MVNLVELSPAFDDGSVNIDRVIKLLEVVMAHLGDFGGSSRLMWQSLAEQLHGYKATTIVLADSVVGSFEETQVWMEQEDVVPV